MSTNKEINLYEVIVKKTLRVPSTNVEAGFKSKTIAMQFDGVLIENGFKASPELMTYVAHLDPAAATQITRTVLSTVKQLVGSHVKHNTYFKEFPSNVPDTEEFWAELIEKTYGSTENAPLFINLLELDGYGKYAHTFEEMVAMHTPLLDSKNFKSRLISLGGTLNEECTALYRSLAGSKIPLNDEDKVILAELAAIYVAVELDEIPQRENRAIINKARIEAGKEILVDNLTDILRLAVVLSGGDVSLQTKTKFKSFPQAQRRIFVKAIHDVVTKNPAKLGDVSKNKEVWKRFAYRLNSTAFKTTNGTIRLAHALYVDKNNSFEAAVEKAFATNDMSRVVAVLVNNPGMFAKNLNRVLLNAKLKDVKTIVTGFTDAVDSISTPVLIGLAQYLDNRLETKTDRIFANRKGTAHVVKDEQSTLPPDTVRLVRSVIDGEITKRLPEGNYVVGEDLDGIAIPLSNKLLDSGLDILPKGSIDVVAPDVLRFFIYWHEDGARTDYDLSAVLLDKDFNNVGQVSYTNLRSQGIVHSGDITSAPKGASEFIDITLGKLADNVKFIVPQINLYSGNKFDEAKEAFFGYMERTTEQLGMPYEPKTVTTKSDLTGGLSVAMPLLFSKEDNGEWLVKWTHLNLNGYGWGNATENNKLSTSKLVRAVYETKYITLKYLIDLLRAKDGAEVFSQAEFEKILSDDPVAFDATEWTFVGRNLPAQVPVGSKYISMRNIQELLP